MPLCPLDCPFLSLLVAAFGGTTNNTRQFCKFPFTYLGNPQSVCLRSDPPTPSSNPAIIQPWCSLTDNYDRDRQWGFCNLGVTDSTSYYICRSGLQSLRCPAGYVIDILTANYAAKPDGNIGAGACVPSPNDCLQSTASNVQSTCAGKTTCTAIHLAQTLASCQNRPTAYLHIEYTCVPNTIQDIPRYNLCNATFVPEGDTSRGYLSSPDFPRSPSGIDCTFNLQTIQPFQDIYLYVLEMDLNTPDVFGQPCRKDRLLINSDNSERELCGRATTDLLINTCHAAISLQLIRSADAKGGGVKFYFEFRDRLPGEICTPLVTTTARPATLSPTAPTTTGIPGLPSYFPNPSPRMLKSLCYLDLSGLFGTKNFQCPADYVIVVHRAFYGKGNRCDYTPGDCISETNTVAQACAGKQSCSVTFLNQVILTECDRSTANYLFVEYQCLPTPGIAENVQDLCTFQANQLGELSGVLRSPSYPVYAQSQCPNVTFSSFPGSNLVTHMYLLDLSIGAADPNTGECNNDYLSLSYQCNNQSYTRRLCGSGSTELLFDTCSPTDQIYASYNLVSQDMGSQRGFALLYYFLAPLPPGVTTTSRLPPTVTTTQPVIPPGPGAVSEPIIPSTSCVQRLLTLTCGRPGYVLIIHKIYLSVSASGGCNFSPNDCFEDRTNSYTFCGGRPFCSISPPAVAIKGCNNSRSTYLYTEHQCIPSRPKLNLDICSSTSPFERVEGAAVISSLNYTSTYRNCQIQLQSRPLLGSTTHRAFKIFILSLNLPMQPVAREQGVLCTDRDPVIEIDDPEEGVTRLCGTSHPRYVLETCSNTINLRFKNVETGATPRPVGFELYFESIENDQCRVIPNTTPTPPSEALAIENRTACALALDRERVNFGCTPDHGLVFLQSYNFVTNQPTVCDVSQDRCHFPSDQPRAQCSGQQSCSFVYNRPVNTPSSACGDALADSIQFYYQCLPMRPVAPYSKFTLCTDRVVNTMSGFVDTPSYPTTYQTGHQSCQLRFPLPSDNESQKFSVHLYVIDLSLRDSSIVNPLVDITCLDSLKYDDGENSATLCGKIDQPVLQYSTNQKELTLSLNLTGGTPTSELTNWKGARLFFIIRSQALPVPPGITTTSPGTATSSTTESSTIEATDAPPKQPNGHGGLIAGLIIGILVALLLVVGGIWYYKRHQQTQHSSANRTEIRYESGKDEVQGAMTNGSSDQRSSIPSSSLKAPSTSTITSPFYKRLQTPTLEATTP